MIVTTDENHILSLITEARQGKTVRMLGIGKSMTPLLKDGRDFIDLIAVDNETALNKYDVVFYKSHKGEYVLHRIYSISKAGYYPNGDGNRTLEPLLQREKIYLKAIGFIRKGRYVSVQSLWYRCYVKIWANSLPTRGLLLRCYHWICRVRDIMQRKSSNENKKRSGYKKYHG